LVFSAASSSPISPSNRFLQFSWDKSSSFLQTPCRTKVVPCQNLVNGM
jgi:hypothetical protein